mmetsp:Transcript_36976/g.92883  ORF Transcript_36976/g.92883 Transcript_36976/m.92883 type:complete len:137 (-) Transcript_36976:280-690(-)
MPPPNPIRDTTKNITPIPMTRANGFVISPTVFSLPIPTYPVTPKKMQMHPKITPKKLTMKSVVRDAKSLKSPGFEVRSERSPGILQLAFALITVRSRQGEKSAVQVDLLTRSVGDLWTHSLCLGPMGGQQRRRFSD